jgi:hypothetical protein
MRSFLFPVPGIESETENYNLIAPGFLTLALFMAWILADHTNYPLTPNNLAIPAYFLD